MKITAVEPQKKRKGRFNIFLDGKFAFGADEDSVVNNRLITGKDISTENLEKILFEVEIGKLMERMYRLFSIRQRSEKEIRDYLKILSFRNKIKDEEELSDVVIETLITNLKKKGLINDEIFAREWVNARQRSKQKGRTAIKSELIQKGIDKEIIENVLLESGGEEKEKLLAVQSLEKKARVWKGLEELEFKKKAIDFLIRRGFDYSLAKEVVIQFLNKRNDI